MWLLYDLLFCYSQIKIGFRVPWIKLTEAMMELWMYAVVFNRHSLWLCTSCSHHALKKAQPSPVINIRVTGDEKSLWSTCKAQPDTCKMNHLNCKQQGWWVVHPLRTSSHCFVSYFCTYPSIQRGVATLQVNWLLNLGPMWLHLCCRCSTAA